MDVFVRSTLQTAYELVIRAKEQAQQDREDVAPADGAVRARKLMQLEAKVLREHSQCPLVAVAEP